MIIFLSVVIAVLLVVVVIQYISRKRIDRQLNVILNRLSDIIEQESAQKVYLQTDAAVIRQFLIRINRLLDYNQKVAADYARAKESLRKMMSNMSHDLKTPLTVILGYVEKLQTDQRMSEAERRETTDRLQRKTRTVIDLLNQFFDLVKLESEDYKLPLGKVCLNEICRTNVLEFYSLLQAGKLQVEIDIPEENVYVLANVEAVNRVMSNLISNAIRYGSEGRVFGLTLREEEDKAAVEIWDRGRGIDELHQERVFERLYTVDDARNRDFQGSGLGLSITHHLMKAMKGSIRLQSKPYEKTVFTCEFKRITY